MPNGSALQAVVERGWRSGMTNSLRKELGAWWNTRKWWIQSLVWLLVINGFIALPIWAERQTRMGGVMAARECFGILLAIFGPFAAIGVVILVQGAIVGEKRSGTAAWMLSNPVSRASFILSKLIANTIGILAIVVALQGAVAYLQISIRTGAFLPVVPFMAAMGLQALILLFYLALALMLGAFCGIRGPVIGIPIAFIVAEDLISQLVAKSVPWLPWLLPKKLSEMSVAVAAGQPLPSVIPIVATVLFSSLFVVAAIWRFGREEF
ncbi:MAG: ABC transporter permease subunit [Anaerolineales bacterium]|jgi:ABC-2 type transport system permease protein